MGISRAGMNLDMLTFLVLVVGSGHFGCVHELHDVLPVEHVGWAPGLSPKLRCATKQNYSVDLRSARSAPR